MRASPKRKLPESGDGLMPGGKVSSSLRHYAQSKIKDLRDDLRTTGILSADALVDWGEVAVAHIYRHGELVVVRDGALTFHSDLINSKQAAEHFPIPRDFAHEFCGAFGNNVDFHRTPSSLQSADKHEVLACSTMGQVLVISDVAAGQQQAVETFDKSGTLTKSAGEAVTAVTIVERGLYLVGTKMGLVWRLRRQGRVLQADQLQAATG